MAEAEDFPRIPGDWPQDEEDEESGSDSDFVPKDFEPWARTHCAHINAAQKKAQEESLAEYDRIINLIEDPNHEVWDINGKLTPEFLRRFSSEDRALLLHALRDWEEAPNVNYPPGEGPLIWPWWAERHPQHTEVEWNIYFHYHVRQMLPPEQLAALKELTIWEKLGRAVNTVVRVVSGAAATSIVRIQEPITRPRKRKETEDEPIGDIEKRPRTSQSRHEEGSVRAQKPPTGGKRRPTPLPLSRHKEGTGKDDGVGGRQPPTPLTVRAHKYGKSLHWFFESTYRSQLTPRKSGLTPTHRPLGASPLTPHSRWRDIELVSYQRQELKYMPLEQLHEFEIIEHHHPVPSNLNNPLLPFMEKQYWKPSYKLRPSGQTYNVEDQEVWEAMLPCLRLLTRFLTDCQITDWWDDLAGCIKDETLEFVDDGELSRIPQRRPEERTREPIDWQPLVGQIEWKIDEIASPRPGSIQGITISNDDDTDKFVKVILSYLLLEPLLQSGLKKLTDSERLVQQFYIAVTLFHEMAHAYWMGFGELGGEPFYRDEPYRELGHSMENAVFGGTMEPIIREPREPQLKSSVARLQRHGLPVLGIILFELPNYDYMDMFKPPYLNPRQRDPPTSYKRFPIPTYFIETIQQQDFWDIHIKTLGGALLRIERWILHWLEQRKDLDENRDIVESTDLVRGKRYAERLAESLGLQDPEVNDSKDSSNDITNQFLKARDMKMRAVALRIYMRDQEKKRHSKNFRRNITQEMDDDYVRYAEQRQEDMEAFEDELRKKNDDLAAAMFRERSRRNFRRERG